MHVTIHYQLQRYNEPFTGAVNADCPSHVRYVVQLYIFISSIDRQPSDDTTVQPICSCIG